MIVILQGLLQNPHFTVYQFQAINMAQTMSNPNHALALIYLPLLDQEIIMIGFFEFFVFVFVLRLTVYRPYPKIVYGQR